MPVWGALGTNAPAGGTKKKGMADAGPGHGLHSGEEFAVHAARHLKVAIVPRGGRDPGPPHRRAIRGLGREGAQSDQ